MLPVLYPEMFFLYCLPLGPVLGSLRFACFVGWGSPQGWWVGLSGLGVCHHQQE